MMNRVVGLESHKGDGRKLEEAEKVNRLSQAVALELRELRSGLGMIFVIPLEQVGGGLNGSRHRTVAGSLKFSKRNPVEEKTLAGCDMPGEFERAFGRRIWFPATVVGRYSFNHASRGLVFITDLGKINLVQEKER